MKISFCALLLTLLAGCAAGGPPGPLSVPAKMYAGVDASRRVITTTSPEAQAWFDQGLTLMYGFNHQEAVRSFHAATEADPGCAMAWWGLAIASGVDLNDSSMSRGECRLAYDAAQTAARNAADASPVEAALARAIATRYAWPPPEDRAALDQAYAEAMQAVWTAHPDDPDVATCYADSLMLLHPWDYWTTEREPKGRVEEAVAALEHALNLAPDHAGACHYLVHALEAGDPKRAEAAAVAVPEGWRMGSNTWDQFEGVARNMLAGEILWREGRVDEAFGAMAEGARLEDELVYDEPPGWMQPVRHAWGALLMAARRPAEAERVYRDDLEDNPGNGWSLLGLGQALRAQGESAEASAVEAQLAVAWRRADSEATSSCFCEPGYADA